MWREIFDRLIRTDPVTPRKKKQNSDEKLFETVILEINPACLYFLVTFYNYPARNIVNKEKKRKPKKWREIFSRLIQTDPVPPKQRKQKQNSDERYSLVLIGTDPREKEGFLDWISVPSAQYRRLKLIPFPVYYSACKGIPWGVCWRFQFDHIDENITINTCLTCKSEKAYQ